MLTEAGEAFSQTEFVVTGGNGFLGKVILGLLLDRYPSLKRLHIVLRPRGELSAAERFEAEVLRSPPLAPACERLGASVVRDKLTVIEGDVSAPGCGISRHALESLCGRAGLVLNCAGRVDFFPPLDDSLSANVDGAENAADLAQQIGAKLLHVSTCFVCGEADGLVEESDPIPGYYPHRRGIDDRRFDHHQELLHARAMIRQIYESDGGDRSRRSRELAQRLTALGRQRSAEWGWVNTYTYTKSLGEQVIASAKGLEFTIVRPAIVESAWRFPAPGWIEGGRTAAPLVLMALGGQKDWPVREDAPLEVIPVDMAAAGILTAAAQLLAGRHEPVYQLGSADANPVELGSIVRWLDAEARRRKDGGGWLGRSLTGWLTGNRLGAKVRFVSQAESQSRSARRETSAARLERRISSIGASAQRAGLPGRRWLEGMTAELRKLGLRSRFREQTLGQYLPFVLQNRYVFECENIRAAWSNLAPPDRKLLLWRPEEIRWKDYWIDHQIAGIEKWVQPEAVREWTFKI